MNAASLARPGSGYRTLWLIVGLLLLPFALAGALYASGWQPTRTVEHGQLLSPPLALPDQLLRSTAELRGKWLLLFTIDGPCDQACTRRIDEMRRIQVALNKNMGRVARVVLSDRPDDPALLALQHAQPDLRLLAAAGATPHLQIADPQGRLLLTYPPDATAQGVRADLERLLKFAWNG